MRVAWPRRQFLRDSASAVAGMGFQGPVYAEPFKRSLTELAPDEAVRRTAEALHCALALVP